MSEMHDPYEDQLAAARYRAERDQARQELARLKDRSRDTTVSAYDLLPEEDREALRWVRGHGGLGSVRKLLDWVVGYCSIKQQLDFDFWLSGRVMHELGFEEDMADRDEVERRLLARLMPEGYEWPRYESGGLVLFGDEFINAKGNASTLRTIAIKDCRDALGGAVFWKLGKGACAVTLENGERVKRPAPKVLDADGVEIREKCDVWWICEGDERGVHAERLRVETICPNGLIECSPYNGGTWVYLEPSELYVNKPVPSSDGKPLRYGETVWSVDSGTRYTVEKITDELIPVKCRSEMGSTVSLHPSQLTHERPESWGQLEKDATRLSPYYYARDVIGLDTDKMPPKESRRIDMMRDLVRRAKALAGVSE